MDCPSNKPPTFDIQLRNSIQADLAGTETAMPPSDAAPVKKTRLSKRKAVEEAAAAKAAEDELLAARIRAEVETVADRRVAATKAEAARTKMAAEALISGASKRRRVDVASSSQFVDVSDNDVLET